MASASPSKVLPAAVLQMEFLSEGCHKPTLPVKDAKMRAEERCPPREK